MAHIDCSFYSPSLKKNAHVIAFIPTMCADDYLEGWEKDYNKKEKTYPALYLLHGSYGDCMDWTRFTGVERYAQDKGIAVIMPSAENSRYLDMEYGEAYLTYVAAELPEFMRKIFPLSDKREENFIGGLSMGGYGAFRCALEYPERFGYAAALSGALNQEILENTSVPHLRKMPVSYRMAVGNSAEPENDLAELLKKRLAEKRKLPKLYMCCGTEDFVIPTNEQFYNDAKNVGAEITYQRFPGTHDWDFWDEHIKDVLAWVKPCYNS